MIRYTLKCSAEHEFEAWFASMAAFDEQQAEGSIECPVCGAHEVDKAIMAPSLTSSRKEKARRETAVAGEGMKALRKLCEYVEKNCDYVGPRFAEEARKIHNGDADARNIYGEASREETESLREDGVEFETIPWAPRDNA